jgi:hypothetical protein
MAAGYANTDKMKAIELFNRLLLILRMDMQSNQLRCLKTRNNNICACYKPIVEELSVFLHALFVLTHNGDIACIADG